MGPNRCELIYNHEKQPSIELSLRVSPPVVELLETLRLPLQGLTPRSLNAPQPNPQQLTFNARVQQALPP